MKKLFKLLTVSFIVEPVFVNSFTGKQKRNLRRKGIQC